MNKDGGLSHKLHGLDHLRAFAIIFVFFFHYGRLFPHPDESKITTKIAALSYGIYLTHKIVIHVTQTQFSKVTIANNSNIMFIICIATVFIASIILNEIIEKPFLKLRKKILKKEKAGLNELAEAA